MCPQNYLLHLSGGKRGLAKPKRVVLAKLLRAGAYFPLNRTLVVRGLRRRRVVVRVLFPPPHVNLLYTSEHPPLTV